MPDSSRTPEFDVTSRTRRSGTASHYAVVGEPNDWTLRALTSILGANGFAVIRARSAAELLERTRAAQPDIVLVSDSFPDLPAVDTCRVLRGMGSFNPATPVLVTTSGVTGEAMRIAHLRAGAWDTIKMPANAEELLLRVQRFVDAKVRSDAASARGMLDGSTGFYNLHGLLHRTEEEISEAWRFRRTLSCVVFGPCPDVPGDPRLEAPEGRDRARVAEGLLEVFRRMGRRSDVIGRLNPLEYIVIAPSTDEAGAVRLATRLLAELQHLTLTTDAGPDDPLAIHAGFHSPGAPAPAGLTPATLVGRATGALRRRQAEGPGSSDRPWIRWEPGDGEELDLSGGQTERPPPLTAP